MANQFVNPVAEVLFEAESPYTELLLGCGNDRRKLLALKDETHEWKNLITLDSDISCNPDVQWDLNNLPLPFHDESFNEVHIYECLEHFGKQGDFVSFFAFFTEIHRILRKDGTIYGSVPCWDSPWAWGDPGHTRVITDGTLSFLSQKLYGEKDKPTTDYRHIYKVDFIPEWKEEKGERMYFALRKA